MKPPCTTGQSQPLSQGPHISLPLDPCMLGQGLTKQELTTCVSGPSTPPISLKVLFLSVLSGCWWMGGRKEERPAREIGLVSLRKSLHQEGHPVILRSGRS